MLVWKSAIILTISKTKFPKIHTEDVWVGEDIPTRRQWLVPGGGSYRRVMLAFFFFILQIFYSKWVFL